MRKFITIILLLLFANQLLIGQQDRTYSNYLLNAYYFNPAIAGSTGGSTANLSYRNQWVGFDGAPKSIMANVSGSIKNEGKIGYGVTIMSEKTGVTNNTSFLLTYAQHFKLNDKLKIGLGLQTGYLQHRVKLYSINVADQGDDVFTGNILSENGLDLNAGINLYSENLYLMASIKHLINNDMGFSSYNSRLEKQYNFIGGYKFSFEKQKIDLEPSLLVIAMSNIPIQYSPMVKMTYNKAYWSGVSYTVSESVGLSLGYLLKERLNIGYTYNFAVSKLNNYNSGTHEFTLSYILTHKKPSLEEEDEKLNNSILDDMKRKMKEKK